ncbi:2-dehydropantoate 2-reductase [Xanthobacter sp. V3C-3]|uniref:2-dehydropantoate 2-reductase n=1 Tax=Xanthobacter lutulentifluminis TaxID=3119935 RepID=UPI003729704F
MAFAQASASAIAVADDAERQGYMRILILGAGGVGGYYGGRVLAAGGDVAFLVREKRAEQIARDGLVIRSPKGDTQLNAPTLRAADRPFDVVILACKAYDLESAMDAIAPAVGPDSLVLPLLNGLCHLDALDGRFGRSRVLGGLAHIGVVLNEAGHIEHLNSLEFFALGARDEIQQARVEALHDILGRGGFAPRLSSSIMQDMWEKFAFLATYAGITCLMRAPIGVICATTDGRDLALAMFEECARVAIAAGHPLRSAFVEESRATLGDRKSSGTSSMMRDMLRGARTEHEHIVGDMLRRGRRAGISMPLLSVAYASLQAYDHRRQG